MTSASPVLDDFLKSQKVPTKIFQRKWIYEGVMCNTTQQDGLLQLYLY